MCAPCYGQESRWAGGWMDSQTVTEEEMIPTCQKAYGNTKITLVFERLLIL